MFFIENFWYSFLNDIKQFFLHFIKFSQENHTLTAISVTPGRNQKWRVKPVLLAKYRHRQEMQVRIRLCLPYFKLVYYSTHKQKLKHAELCHFYHPFISIFLYIFIKQLQNVCLILKSQVFMSMKIFVASARFPAASLPFFNSSTQKWAQYLSLERWEDHS